MGVFSQLHPTFRPYAEHIFAVANYYGLEPRITSAYRSISEQRRLYQRWLRGQNPYPAAAPGRSFHNYGLAIDMVTKNNAGLGKYWQSLGGIWGGSRDPVHFQHP